MTNDRDGKFSIKISEIPQAYKVMDTMYDRCYFNVDVLSRQNQPVVMSGSKFEAAALFNVTQRKQIWGRKQEVKVRWDARSSEQSFHPEQSDRHRSHSCDTLSHFMNQSDNDESVDNLIISYIMNIT